MGLFQFKPIKVEAFQYQMDKTPLWFIAGISRKEIWSYETYCVIPTKHSKTGKMRVDTGNFIIKHPDNSLSRLEAEEFHERYEPTGKAPADTVQKQKAGA